MEGLSAKLMTVFCRTDRRPPGDAASAKGQSSCAQVSRRAPCGTGRRRGPRHGLFSRDLAPPVMNDPAREESSASTVVVICGRRGAASTGGSGAGSAVRWALLPATTAVSGSCQVRQILVRVRLRGAFGRRHEVRCGRRGGVRCRRGPRRSTCGRAYTVRVSRSRCHGRRDVTAGQHCPRGIRPWCRTGSARVLRVDVVCVRGLYRKGLCEPPVSWRVPDRDHCAAGRLLASMGRGDGAASGHSGGNASGHSRR